MEEQGSSKRPWIIGAVVIAALAIVVAYALNMDRQQMDRTTTEDTSATPKPSGMSKQPPLNEDDKKDEGITITFTDDGFTPKEYTVQANRTVKVKNDSSMQLQFSSDDHPTHTEETELNLPVLQPGEEASFTPTRVGNWGFHDHIKDQYTGSLTVTE